MYLVGPALPRCPSGPASDFVGFRRREVRSGWKAPAEAKQKVGRARDGHVPPVPTDHLLRGSREQQQRLHTCLVHSAPLPPYLLLPHQTTGQAHAHATHTSIARETKAEQTSSKGWEGTDDATDFNHGVAAHGRPASPPPGHLLRRRRPLQEQEPAAASTSSANNRASPAVAAAALHDGDGVGGVGAAAAGAAAGRAGGGRRVRDPGGAERRAAAPAGDGRAVRIHALGGLPWLAVAPGAHRPGRDQRAQEAGQARRHAGRSRRRERAAASRAQVAGRNQDRRAHRGEEEAAQGLVPRPPFQRRLHPARPRRARVRRRRAQHLPPDRQALSGTTPLRRSSPHRAVGGGGGAGPGDAEGERDGQEPAHRAQRAQRPALHLADTHRPRDRRQGLRVHHLAMNEYSHRSDEHHAYSAPSLCMSLLFH